MGRDSTAERALAGAAPSQAEPRTRARATSAPEVTRTIHAGAVLHLLHILEGAGHDPRSLLAEAGFGELQGTDLDQRVSMAGYVALWRIAAPRFSNGSLGLTVGAGFEFEHANLLVHMLAHASTIGEAVQRADRYRDLDHEMLLPLLALEGGDAILHRALPPALGGMGAMGEVIVATWVKCLSLYAGVAFQPREVWFQHAAPPDLRRYDDVFSCRVRFEMPELRLIVDPEELERPLRLANPRVLEYLEAQARSQHDNLPHESGLVDRVRGLLAEELRGGHLSQEHVARRLALSPRTLQRRLREEGAAFNDLLEAQRRVLCERYLRDPSLSVQEIAFLLGYNERSSFYRAFRRWTGRTPQELRKGGREETGTGL